MRTALLLGREHHEIGSIELVGEGPAAVALSRGGARKTYDHTHPNEDAGAFAFDSKLRMIAVADGHRGCEAAERALVHLVEREAPDWACADLAPESWAERAVAALCRTNHDILVERGRMSGARTTLALALVIPERDLLLTASVGDSHCFRVGPEEVEDLARGTGAENHFLGHAPETPDSMARKCRTEARTLGDTRALVLATDGLSERGLGVADPERVVREGVQRVEPLRVDRRPLEIARAVAEAALEAQRDQRSGDNLASAVLWIDEA